MSAPAFNPGMIVHQFSVQVSRRLYLDESGGVVCLGQNARVEDATAAGLSGVLVYALIVEGVGIGYMRLAPWGAPLTISQFLRDAWSGTGGFGYRPSLLKTGARFADALPCLARYCADADVEYAIASGTDRSYNRNLQVAQAFATDALWRFNRDEPDRSSVSLAALAAQALQAALDLSDYTSSVAKRHAQSDYARATKRTSLSLTRWPAMMDLEVGPWLFGNQQGIPPRTPSAIKSDVAMWRDPHAFHATDDALREFDFNTGLELSVTDGNFAGNEVVAELLSCWVESPGAVARRIGLSVKELNWYLKNERGLNDAKLYPLLDLFGVDVSMQVEREDGSPVYEAQENYLLFAPDKPAPVVTLYETLSHGGDLDFSVELLPRSGQLDPHWRYLLLGCFVEIHVMAFGRGTASAALLDKSGEHARLINYTGAHPVSARFYQATQRLCAEIQRAPEKQFERMRRYASTHETIFDQLEAHHRYI